jgi:chromosome segregation ATPase
MFRLSRKVLTGQAITFNEAVSHGNLFVMSGLTSFALYDMREREKKIWKDLSERETRINKDALTRETRLKEDLYSLETKLAKDLEKINNRLDEVEKTLSDLKLAISNHSH